MQTYAPRYLLLNDAEGTIQASDMQQDRLDEITQRLASGEFYTTTAGHVPSKCIDGRMSDDPTNGPNAAGGTETIFVADDLTTKRYRMDDGSVTGGVQNIITRMQELGYAIGGHSDNVHTDPYASGCGANDKLSKIYDMIVQKSDTLKNYAEAILGERSVDDETVARIVMNAKTRQEFASGGEVLQVLQQNHADLEELEGSHNEVVAVINLRPGTTLDRSALAHEFGTDYQAFNVDAWSFENAAKAISQSNEETKQKIIAMTFYNLATAFVLCGPAMRVVVAK